MAKSIATSTQSMMKIAEEKLLSMKKLLASLKFQNISQENLCGDEGAN